MIHALAAALLTLPLAQAPATPAAIATLAGKTYVAAPNGIARLDGATPQQFASGIEAPTGLAGYQQWLFATNRSHIYRIDAKGKVDTLVAPEALPEGCGSLNGLTIDGENGTLYVAAEKAILRVTPKGKASKVALSKDKCDLKNPSRLVLDGASFLLVTDDSTKLHRLRLSDGTTEQVADLGAPGTGIAWDPYGRLYISTGKELLGLPRPGAKPVHIAEAANTADLAYEPSVNRLVLARRDGTAAAAPASIPGAEVDESPAGFETAVAFPNMRWAEWQAEDEKGLVVPLRPIVLTHAGDGSNRIFVATQHGVIHVFPKQENPTQTKVFLDIKDRVIYSDKQNEEGFLGLAFHPSFKTNGELFVFYTPKRMKKTNLISRFRLSKDDPSRVDPASEEEVLRIERPFWNHDGGTIAFGPDGYLYVALGDGGAAADPYNNGQNLKTVLGKVLRLDIDRKDAGKGYSIPKDNPFVGQADALPEIWAYGLRNIWRMAFDRETKRLWAGEVGQNLYEEINLIERGGNYGWRKRESLHPFGPQGVSQQPDLIDPIWEYHHDVGKSITGGLVYRGKALPELRGAYLYADYVSGKLWALRYDEAKKRVTSNRPIKDRALPILSFGEDEEGEAYCMTYTPSGQGIYKFLPIR